MFYTLIGVSLVVCLFILSNLLTLNAFSIVVRSQDVVAPAILMPAINVGMLTVWAVIAPRRYTRVLEGSFDRWGRHNRYEMKCISFGQYDWMFPVLLFVWNCCVLLAANYQAFKARSIRTEFGESVFIGLIMVYILQIALISVPVRMQTEMTHDLRYLMWSLLVLTVSGATFFILFVPKVIALLEQKAEERKKEFKRELHRNGDAMMIDQEQKLASEGLPQQFEALQDPERSPNYECSPSVIGTFVVRRTKNDSALGVTKISGLPGYPGHDSTQSLLRKRRGFHQSSSLFSREAFDPRLSDTRVCPLVALGATTLHSN